MNEPPPPLPVSSRPKNCGLAVWSLVLGILGVVFSPVLIGLLLAIPAVICGHTAYGRISRSHGTLAGQGLALGGLITGYLSIALIPIIAMLAAIAIPNFVRARNVAQRNACLYNLRMIDGAKQRWALENKKEGTDIPTAEDIKVYLSDKPFPVCPAGGVYTVNAVDQAPACSTPGHILPSL
jgi:hypothetical protein